MKFFSLTLLFFLIQCNFLFGQFEKKSNYDFDHGFFTEAHVFPLESEDIMIHVTGEELSALSMIDDNLNVHWNLEVLKSNYSSWFQEYHTGLCYTNKDSIYLFGTEIFDVNSSASSILLLNVNHKGDTISTKTIRFNKDYFFRDMIFDGLHHYFIATDDISSVFVKLNDQNGVVWAHQYTTESGKLSFKKVIQESDSTFLIYAQGLDDENNVDILIRTNEAGDIMWSRKMAEENVQAIDFFIHNEQIFTLSVMDYSSKVQISIINELDSIIRKFEFLNEWKLKNELQIIHVNDSTINFTAGKKIYEVNYLTGEVEIFLSGYNFIATNYSDTSKEFYLLNIGNIALFPGFYHFGLLSGTNLDLINTNFEAFCLSTSQEQSVEIEAFNSSINLIKEDVFYSYSSLPVIIEFHSLNKQDGCLDLSWNVFEESLASSIFISPNPSNGNFRIRNEKGSIDKIYLFNIMGILIQEIDGNGAEMQNLSVNKAKGAYFVTVISGEKRATKKIIIH